MFNNKSKPVLVFMDVDELYHNTLLLSDRIRPWAVVNGKYVGLELRYRFVIDYLNNRASFDYTDTDYYEFIENYTRAEFSGAYDGNRSYAMTNAADICRRYVALINSIIKNIKVYNALNQDNIESSMQSIYDDVIEFEKQNRKEVFYIKEQRYSIQTENRQYERGVDFLKSTINKRLIGHLVPSGVVYKGNLIVKNGSHRLAAFKALKDKGIFINKLPIYLIG